MHCFVLNIVLHTLCFCHIHIVCELFPVQDLVTPVSPFFSPSHESWKLEPLIFNPFPLQLKETHAAQFFFGWNEGGVMEERFFGIWELI